MISSGEKGAKISGSVTTLRVFHSLLFLIYVFGNKILDQCFAQQGLQPGRIKCSDCCVYSSFIGIKTDMEVQNDKIRRLMTSLFFYTFILFVNKSTTNLNVPGVS